MFGVAWGAIWLLRLDWICWLRVGLLGLVVCVRIDCLTGLLWICCADAWLLLCFGFVGLLFVVIMVVSLLGGLICFEFCLV